MLKKVSSYKKLKDRISILERENGRLNNMITLLVIEPDSSRANRVRRMVRFKYEADKYAMFGEPTIMINRHGSDHGLDGIFNQMSKG